jgi:uncharacterized protein (TIGR02271 family)
VITTEQLRDIMGAEVRTTDGDKIGSAGQIYTDDQTGRPEWVTVKTGLFGSNESFIPLAQAEYSGGAITVPYSKDMIKNAPTIDPDMGHLSQAEEAELYRYFGLEYSELGSDTGLPSGGMGTETGMATGTTTGQTFTEERGTVGHDTSGPTTDDAMTRSEERLRVGTERVEAGRARLRKYVVTENVTQTVPVTREEVRIEREPITDANVDRAMAGPAISEEEHEVVLHEERPVVAKEAVPVERVRLTKDQVTEQETVSDEVRKEQIDETGTEATADRDIDLNAGTESETRRI